jgi:hypothetical protein
MIRSHEFTLRLGREITEAEADALYAACPDATIESGPGGAIVEFTREAPSWAEAIGSAVRDIEMAVPGLRVTGAGQDDLVTMRDIARRAKRSRESVRLWAVGKRGPGGFPAPAWESPGGERFWLWPEVARWIRNHFNLAVEVTPNEIRWADAILKARQAAAEAQQALAEADEETRRELSALLGAA